MKNYEDRQGIDYTPESERSSYQCLKVLKFLYGRKWDEVAMAYVHSLRPSYIRVVGGEVQEQTCDGCTWRVTVYITPEYIIRYIEQEVEVWLPEGVAHGQALKNALVYGVDSPQCRWWQDATSTMYNGISGVFTKTNEAGEVVPFPVPKSKGHEMRKTATH